MTTPLNPFPDYAVMRLVSGQQTNVTVVTAPIEQGRKLVDDYVEGLTAQLRGDRSHAALCAVRGDYGTGKTHLLNDVASYLKQHCDCTEAPSIVRATCIEADPLMWYRTQIGPQVDTLPLYDIALRLYGRAGKTVASALALTESAVEVLDQDPTRIRDLVRRNHLSIDDVGRAFETLLGKLCKDADATVRRVLTRLVSSETDGPAREWIRGETLTNHKAELLGVPKSIESAEQASAVMGAIASMHNALGRPFVMLVDELEHFVRHDVATGASKNVTWLKRLLEQLGSAGALAIVAGHWSAWETTGDYLDRFPQHAPIDLVKLESSEVLDIVKARVPNLPPTFDETSARVIAQVTAGNMRRIMSLCSLLFRQSGGFQEKLSETQIRETWTSVAQRISQEQVSEEIATLLLSHGFAVKTADASFGGIPFDLVAEREDGRVLLVQSKHSTTQGDHYDAAQKFIGKLANLANREQHVLGLFLANGSIDDELLRILREAPVPNLRWFDLTERDVMDKIRAEVTTVATDRAGMKAQAEQVSAAAEAIRQALAEQSARLMDMNAKLMQRLQAFEQERHQQAQALQLRVHNLSIETESSRDESVLFQSQIRSERAHASYEAMIEEPRVDTKLRFAGGWMIFAMGMVALGLFLIVQRDMVAYLIGLRLSISAALLGSLSIFFGCWLMWRIYALISEYFEFARQLIHDLYVRDVPIDELQKVNTILRQTIQHTPLKLAQVVALDRLRTEKTLSSSVRFHLHNILPG